MHVSKKIKKERYLHTVLQMHWSLRGKISTFASMMHVQLRGLRMKATSFEANATSTSELSQLRFPLRLLQQGKGFLKDARISPGKTSQFIWFVCLFLLSRKSNMLA